ncbi:MAG: RNA polymerase sigma factor [Lachnospiraceae bacterium]|nr:RNA polymerase sigma factor [Lachnospiraceae bacterium]
MEDRLIINLYLARDERAIIETEKVYGEEILRFAERILKSREDAEEIENDTFLSCWNRIPPNKPYDYFRAFLYKIARHLSFDRLRIAGAKKRDAEIVELSEEMAMCLPSQGNTEDAVEEKLLRETMNRWLLTLPADKRVFFIRRYYLLEGIRQIAEEYGVSESRVKASLYRTREALRKYLIKEGYAI